tara:strand:- start:627 stop:1304 length:678 start_codon:yes stop_codon:yes gene_type:complete
MRLILAMSSLVLFFFQFVSAEERVLYEQVIDNKPALQTEATVYLGDRMLTQRKGAWKECITPKETLQVKKWGFNVVYKGNEPACKASLGSKDYTPTYELVPNQPMMDIVWKPKANKSKLCVRMIFGGTNYCAKKLSEDSVVEGETFIYEPNSFQQSWEYAGRNDDILKFAYSEFTDNFSRQAFSREFQIDLSEGNIAAYKGAIVEIVDATNVQITYKVIRNFESE